MIAESPSSDNIESEESENKESESIAEEHVLLLPGLTLDGLSHVAALVARCVQPGDVIFLRGPLGAGKTTFTQAFCRAFGITEPVTSPTFTLIHEYHAGGDLPVWHLDGYRVSELSPEDVESKLMPLEEALAERQAVFVIEWPDKLPAPRPMPTWELSLTHDVSHELARVLMIQRAPEALALALASENT